MFPRQTIQHHSNPSLCPNHWSQRSWSWLVLWRPTTPSRTNTGKGCPFHHRGLDCKSSVSRFIFFFFFFAIGCPCVLAPFVKKTILAPLYYLWSFVKDQLTLFKWVYFWPLHSVLVIYLSVLSPITHCLDYCSFIVSLMVVQICSLILCWLFWVFVSLYKLVDIHKISWGDFVWECMKKDWKVFLEYIFLWIIL